MSFVPAPQQANAANALKQNGGNQVTNTASSAAAAATTAEGDAPEISDQELIFKLRTFDVYWVEKKALMYRDGIAKVRNCSNFCLGE